jgi:hypothetical protein
MKTTILIVAIAAAVMTASAQTPAPKAALTKTDLRKLIEDTEWISPKRPGSPVERTFVFRKGGEMIDSSLGGKYRFYALETPDILKIYHGNPKRNRKAEFVFFRVNAAAMTAQQDMAASTIGGEMFLKFVGPAKPPK